MSRPTRFAIHAGYEPDLKNGTLVAPSGGGAPSGGPSIGGGGGGGGGGGAGPSGPSHDHDHDHTPGGPATSSSLGGRSPGGSSRLRLRSSAPRS